MFKKKVIKKNIYNKDIMSYNKKGLREKAGKEKDALFIIISVIM